MHEFEAAPAGYADAMASSALPTAPEVAVMPPYANLDILGPDAEIAVQFLEVMERYGMPD